MNRSLLLVGVTLGVGLAAGYGLRLVAESRTSMMDSTRGPLEHAAHASVGIEPSRTPGASADQPQRSPAHTGHGAERKILYWVDPMHPAYTSDKPGKAPDCGMELVPVYADDQPEGPPGTVRLNAEKRQMIGIKTDTVSRQPLIKTIRAVALVDYDETKVREVRTKISGWVKDLFVDFTGKEVEQGQPLFTVYSPELVSTQTEYLLALEGKRKLEHSAFPEAAIGSESLLEASRKRLLLWDITPREIRELEESKTPKTFLTLYSPIKGFVVRKEVFAGKYVTPETELFTIADLSTVWVNADIYEYELPLIRLGQEATISLAYYPGETFRGGVVYLYPYLSGETRTARVRFEFPNPAWKLKPQMYANVELRVDLGEQLVIPQDAVLDSGARKVAFVAHDDGRFEPRDLQLGQVVEPLVAVVSGVEAGERIVVSGNYLIDSESRLKSALTGMGHQHGK